MIIFKYFLEAQILNIHDLNANLNYLSSNVLSLYCIFDVQNLTLCLNCELIKIIDYKIMLKSLCKTTFNSVFVGKNFIKIEQELSLECFEKLWLYTCMKYSKKITVTEYLLHVSVHEIETNEGDNLFTLRQEKIK